ncbi:hypothetical protein AAAV92_10900 [Selenomonas noxia]|uniref:hypothetical protein n=1 Tax=Selenomonas noxia TaxID=135083 RepID=UPI0032C1E225
MAGIKLPQELIDALAQQEANALLEGLQTPTMRRNPAFLAKVRQFLKDNDFITTTETEGVETIVRDMQNIPDLVNGAEVVH